MAYELRNRDTRSDTPADGPLSSREAYDADAAVPVLPAADERGDGERRTRTRASAESRAARRHRHRRRRPSRHLRLCAGGDRRAGGGVRAEPRLRFFRALDVAWTRRGARVRAFRRAGARALLCTAP